MAHQFGGEWTKEKLLRLQKYLKAYTTIFNSNEKARKLHFMYVDAFAGTGSFQKTQSQVTGQADIFSDNVPEIEEFLKGSARIALEINPPFREYIFIERNPEYAQQLQQLKNEFAGRKIKIINEDANSYLLRWCESTNWKTARAVVFLDPYGMEVEWNVIEALARTEAVDLWYLFPLGIGVNRLLTRSGPPAIKKVRKGAHGSLPAPTCLDDHRRL
jgi:three-Cys-motif partner protein